MSKHERELAVAQNLKMMAGLEQGEEGELDGETPGKKTASK